MAGKLIINKTENDTHVRFYDFLLMAVVFFSTG